MYELIIADADIPLFKAAKSVQEDYIIVSGPGFKDLELPNVTALWGHHKKKAHGWLEGYNRELAQELAVLPEELTVEHCVRLSPEVDDHMEAAERSFGGFVGKLKKSGLAEDYLLCIGGEGNFRYEAATLQPYKGKRKEKPLLFHELKRKVIQQYGKRVVLANDQEADDLLGIYGTEDYKHFKKTGVHKYLLAYIDKDIDMVLADSVNFDDDWSEEIPFRMPTAFDCATCFAIQLLMGDKGTDNIPGLPKLTPELHSKYGVRKANGLGEATAKGLLKTCETVPELFERVVEAYKSYYEGLPTTTDFRRESDCVGYNGEMLFYGYMDYLQENAILLWMRREEGEMFDVRKFLDRLGVKY